MKSLYIISIGIFWTHLFLYTECIVVVLFSLYRSKDPNMLNIAKDKYSAQIIPVDYDHIWSCFIILERQFCFRI